MRKLMVVLAFVFASASLAGTLPDAPHIYVEGEHTTRVAPDRFMVRASISEVAPSSSEASAPVGQRLQVLIEEAIRLGVPPDQVRAFELSIRPEYEWKDGHRVSIGTRVTRQVEFTLHEIDKTQQLIDAMVDANVAEIDEARAFSSREAKLRQAATSAAVDNAQERARSLAERSGRRVGALYSVSEFQEHYRPTGYSHYRAPGALSMTREQTTLTPGFVEIRGRAFVVFLLED